MNSTQLVTTILVLLTSCLVVCLATADEQSKTSEKQQQSQQQASSNNLPHSEDKSSIQQEHGSSSANSQDLSVSSRAVPARSMRSVEDGFMFDSAHSIAKRAVIPKFVGKRAYRYEARKAPWFVGKRNAVADLEDGVDGDGDDFDAYSDKRVIIPRFIGKRNGEEDDSSQIWLTEGKRGIPKFVGKRRNSKVPAFIGKRRNSKVPAFIGKRRSSKVPAFIGKRWYSDNSDSFDDIDTGLVDKRSDDEDLINLVNEINRQAELQRLRTIIANDKRQNAPHFIGKRFDGDESSR